MIQLQEGRLLNQYQLVVLEEMKEQKSLNLPRNTLSGSKEENLAYKTQDKHLSNLLNFQYNHTTTVKYNPSIVVFKDQATIDMDVLLINCN